jgi:acetyl esterase/lipase
MPTALLLAMLVLQDDVLFEKDLQYGRGGGEALHLNLGRPAKEGPPRPCVLVVHGGGWAAGARHHHDAQVKELARRGYVAATVGYRFAPRHPFPAQVEDVKCAVRFLRAHAERYGIDKERLGAVGFSAGAHLSMLLGTMDAGDGLEGEGGWADQPSKVQAVVAWFGPTDFSAEYPEKSRGIVRNFIGGTLQEKPEQYRLASPIHYVNPGDAPMLLLQGTKDPLVPHDQAFRMIEALSNAGIRGRADILIGAGHGWGGEELKRTLEASWSWFDEHLKK